MKKPASGSSWIIEWAREAELSQENRGNVSAILVVLQRIRKEGKIRDQLRIINDEIANERWRGFAGLSLFLTPNEGQIAKISGSSTQRILLEHGIGLSYLGKDGGRTSRGNFRPVRMLCSQIVDALPKDPNGWDSIIESWESDIISEYVLPALDENPIEIDLSRHAIAHTVLVEIISKSQSRGVAGPVCQHLVGAKLSKRHWSSSVDEQNHSCFAQDSVLGRHGDFTAGLKAIHVTISPTKDIIRRIIANEDARVESRLLVPESQFSKARKICESLNSNCVVTAIEQFVSQNIDEMSTDSSETTLDVLKDIVDIYNARVDAVERSNCGINLSLK